MPFPSDRLRSAGAILLADDDYADPVATRHPDYTGRWLAGFAAVPDTELIVLVQQRYTTPSIRNARSCGDSPSGLQRRRGSGTLLVAGGWLLWKRRRLSLLSNLLLVVILQQVRFRDLRPVDRPAAGFAFQQLQWRPNSRSLVFINSTCTPASSFALGRGTSG